MRFMSIYEINNDPKIKNPILQTMGEDDIKQLQHDEVLEAGKIYLPVIGGVMEFNTIDEENTWLKQL